MASLGLNSLCSGLSDMGIFLVESSQFPGWVGQRNVAQQPHGEKVSKFNERE